MYHTTRVRQTFISESFRFFTRPAEPARPSVQWDTMCGRYALRRVNLVRSDLTAVPLEPFEEFSETRLQLFNVAPSQTMPIVRRNSKDQRVVTVARWGLIPSWAKEPPKAQPCNARAETVHSSGMFREAFARRRCLVPADGFYEWQGAKPPKQPYFIHRKDDRLFAFAGVWERWRGEKDDAPLDTYTIITTTPNDVMKPLHNRMPVILDQADYEKWLDPATKPDEAKELLRPAPNDVLEAYPVSTSVNKPKNNGPELIDPYDDAPLLNLRPTPSEECGGCDDSPGECLAHSPI